MVTAEKGKKTGHDSWQYWQHIGKWDWEQCMMRDNNGKRRSIAFAWDFSSCERFVGVQKVKAGMVGGVPAH